MAKKKILFIGSYLSKHRGSVGPTESLAKYLSIKNFKVQLASTYPNRLARLFDTIFKLLFYTGEVIYIDVYSGNAFKIAEISTWIGKLRNMKLVFMLHGGALPDFLINNNSRVKKLFKNQTNIYSPSHYIVSAFNNYNIEAKYQPNGIDFKKFPSKTSLDKKKLSLLWVRAFDAIYNPNVAIHILDEVKKIIPETTLTMIGPDRGLLKQTKELANKLKLNDCVNFVGPIENSLLYEYYQSHSILINTTSYESFGLALIEAASCGIPIISNKVGEIPFLWEDGKNIRLVENNSIVQYTSCIKLLHENEIVRKNQTDNAQKNIFQFDSQTTNSFWYNLLNNL